MSDLTVKLNREFRPKRTIRGVEVEEDTGMNYVDVYFPDGTQRTMGYITRGEGETRWTPCHAAPQAMYDAIQQAINLQRSGNVAAPYVLDSTVEDDIIDGDEDES